MNAQDRLADIRARMRDEKVNILIGLHDGAHFIEKPNPVMVLSGFKSLGPAAVLLQPDGTMTLVVTPHWDAARTKIADEIANAREATRIAERGYEHLIEIARPGMSEDELAVELKWFMKTLGAEDNFLLLCASPHNRAVQPSNGRKLEMGDIILAEITPSFKGQLAQIC